MAARPWRPGAPFRRGKHEYNGESLRSRRARQVIHPNHRRKNSAIITPSLLKQISYARICRTDLVQSTQNWCSGQLKFLDCFSFRMEPTQVPPYVHYVKDPRDLHSVTSALFNMMEEMKMSGRGAVFVDSLTEMFTLVQEDRPLIFNMLDGVKSWRAKGPKEKLVPFFCSHHTPLRAYADLDDLLFYVVDGIIDIRFNPGFADRGLLVKQFRVRKMKGAPHETYWVTFSVTSKGVTEIPLPVPVLSTEKPRTSRKK